jgi:hypothetical protein
MASTSAAWWYAQAKAWDEKAKSEAASKKKDSAPVHKKKKELEEAELDDPHGVDEEAASAPPPIKRKVPKFRREAKESPPAPSSSPPSPPHQTQEVSAPPTKKKGAKYKRKRRDSDEDTDPGEFETFKICKDLNKIKDLENAYPHLDRSAQTAIRNGMRSVVQGGLRNYLNDDEKKAIVSRKADYNKVLSRGGRKKYNPFVGKRKHIGDHFRKLISEVRAQTSSSSDSSSNEDEEPLNWDGFV